MQIDIPVIWVHIFIFVQVFFLSMPCSYFFFYWRNMEAELKITKVLTVSWLQTQRCARYLSGDPLTEGAN